MGRNHFSEFRNQKSKCVDISIFGAGDPYKCAFLFSSFGEKLQENPV